MTDKQIIAKIRELRQIRPRQDWVVFTKRKILGEEIREQFSDFSLNLRFIFQHKPAFAGLIAIAVLIGVFGFAQNSLPGDTLFTLKKIVEKSQAVFISEKGQSDYDLELAQKRLGELEKIIQENSVKNLASAINEYQANISKVAENLAKEKDGEKVKEIVLGIQNLGNKVKQLESLGTVIGENEDLDKASAQKLIETLETFIKDLKNRSLTEQQQETLAELEKDLENKDYQEALIKLLYIRTPAESGKP